MVRKALKWMFGVWFLVGLLSFAVAGTERTESRWTAGRPTPAEPRISEIAEESDAGELTADDLYPQS